LKVHQKNSTLKPGASYRVTILPGGAGKNDVVGGVVETRVPTLHPSDNPFVAVTSGRGFEVRGIGSMVGFGEAKSQTFGAVQEAGHPLFDLLGRTVIAHHQHRGEVADDGALVLEIIEQAESLRG
jgi:hypothetical protein